MYTTYAVTVDGGSKAIMIAADFVCTLNQNNFKYKFVWDATAVLWKIKQHEVDGRAT